MLKKYNFRIKKYEKRILQAAAESKKGGNIKYVDFIKELGL